MAGKGNKNAEKFNTKAKRKALFKKWFKHISDGFSQRSFPECDFETFKDYCDKYPEDFPAEEIKKAKGNQLLKWEKRNARIADGGKGSAQATQFGLKYITESVDKLTIKHAYDPENPPPPPPAPIQVNNYDLSKLSIEELKELERIGEKLENSNVSDSGS